MATPTQLQEQITLRQKGMCGQCGKKIDEIDSAEKVFISLNSAAETNPTIENTVLICNYCNNENASQIADGDYDMKRYQFPYAGYEDYTTEQKIEDFRDDMNHALTKIATMQDARAARNLINDKIKLLRSFGFGKEVYEEFHTTLTSKLDEVIQMQRAAYERLEQQQIENYNSVKVKVEEVIKSTEEIENIKNAREALIQVQNEMNSVPLKRENKDELLAKFNIAFQNLNKRQSEEWEKYEMECSENYLTLKTKVEAAIEFSATAPIFKEARERLIAAQKEFKGLRLKKDNREELYSKIQEAFTALNIRQDSDREGFSEETEANYEKIKPVVEDAVSFAKDVTNFKQGREALIDAQAAIRDLKLRKDQRDELYALIRETFEGLNSRQSEEREVFDKETAENNTRLEGQLQECATELDNDPEFNKIRDRLIAIQGDVKLINLKREQRNHLFARIRELFAILDKKRKEYRENKVAEKANKLSSIYANLQNRQSRIEESISWDVKSLNFQQEKLQNINTDEEQQIIDDINGKIAMFEARIKEKQDNIDDIKKRIDDVSREINAAKQAQERAEKAVAEKAPASVEPVAEATAEVPAESAPAESAPEATPAE